MPRHLTRSVAIGRGLALAFAFAAGVTAWAEPASAGGVELPDLGAAALGRGGAFTARADDGMAVVYNVAGFAAQRGTRLTLSTSFVDASNGFARAGRYPDDPKNPLTPWGNQPFPVVSAQGAFAVLPSMVLSSDLGLDHVTFFAAFFTPSSTGGGSFPLGVGSGTPNPARYAAVSQSGVVAYPTLGAAYRVTDWLDVGIAGHVVVMSVDAYDVSELDTDKKTCPNVEFQPCDTLQRVQANGLAIAGSAGVMLHPSDSVDIGLQFRSPFASTLDGTVTASSPAVPVLRAPQQSGSIEVDYAFPWVLRGGVRYVSRPAFGGSATTGDKSPGAREKEIDRFDVELDGVYEAWSSASTTTALVPKIGFFQNVRSSVDNGFEDTVSVRLGGSYAFDVGDGLLTARAGAYHETAATDVGQTRPGAASMAKNALTIGAGYRTGPLTIDVGYARVVSPDRDVASGTIRPTNAARQGATFDSTDTPDGKGLLYPAVNNGSYQFSANVLSLGVGVALDTLFGFGRGKS